MTIAKDLDIKYSVAADIALYSLPDKDIESILQEIQNAKSKLVNGMLFSEGRLYKLGYGNLIILLKASANHIKVIDIINSKVYNPREGFNPLTI